MCNSVFLITKLYIGSLQHHLWKLFHSCFCVNLAEYDISAIMQKFCKWVRKTVYQEITACSNLISVSKAKASCLREKEKTVVRWHSKNYNTAIFFCFHFLCHVNPKKKKNSIDFDVYFRKFNWTSRVNLFWQLSILTKLLK